MEETIMSSKEIMKCYEEIIYDLNELSGLVGKAGEKYFDRIVKNLDKIVGNHVPVQKSSTKK